MRILPLCLPSLRFFNCPHKQIICWTLQGKTKRSPVLTVEVLSLTAVAVLWGFWIWLITAEHKSKVQQKLVFRRLIITAIFWLCQQTKPRLGLWKHNAVELRPSRAHNKCHGSILALEPWFNRLRLQKHQIDSGFICQLIQIAFSIPDALPLSSAINPPARRPSRCLPITEHPGERERRQHLRWSTHHKWWKASPKDGPHVSEWVSEKLNV